MYRTLAVVLLCAALAGCGGNVASAPAPTATPPTPAPATGGGTNSGVPASASVVQVTAGQAASGVDIAVSTPVGAPANAQDLGVADMSGAASAFNTGDIIHRNATMRIVLFGPGLGSDMQVTILGPGDIQVSNVRGTTATDNTPGISFTATVAADAALGARTVVLKSSNGNMTSFTGGLEVVP